MMPMLEQVEIVFQIIAENLRLGWGDRSSDLLPLLETVVEERRPATAKPPWLALPLLTCEALGGDLGPAYHVAAALELGRMAAGCLDEWQDEDTDEALWQTIGPARTVNLAMAMIATSHLSLSRLTELDMDPALILDLHNEFSSTMLHMSEGQHADLSGKVSLDNYAQVAGDKSGSLLCLGCRAGAMVAGATNEMVTSYGEFGQALGILAQGWNDLYGMTGAAGKRDVEHGRTLPVLATLALDATQFAPGSNASQAGQLYALAQVQLLHRKAVEALARCPAPGRLGLFLDAYSFDVLLQVETLRARSGGGSGHAP